MFVFETGMNLGGVLTEMPSRSEQGSGRADQGMALTLFRAVQGDRHTQAARAARCVISGNAGWIIERSPRWKWIPSQAPRGQCMAPEQWTTNTAPAATRPDRAVGTGGQWHLANRRTSNRNTADIRNLKT